MQVWDACGAAVSSLQHTGPVSGVHTHPTQLYFATTCLSNAAQCFASTVALCSLEAPAQLLTVSAPAGYEGYQCARFHPDGALVGAGTSDGRVHLWDVSTHSSAPSLELVHHSTLSEVASVAFSSSGVHCAAGSTDGSATLWDLRKSAAPVMVYGERQSDPCECFVVQVPFATTSNGCYREL
jgi:WD40 repeat protein